MFTNRMMREAIKLQAQGKVVDFRKLEREERMRQEQGKLGIQWNKYPQGLMMDIVLRTNFNQLATVCSFRAKDVPNDRFVKEKLDLYNRTHKVFLQQYACNPKNRNLQLRVVKELEGLILSRER